MMSQLLQSFEMGHVSLAEHTEAVLQLFLPSIITDLFCHMIQFSIIDPSCIGAIWLEASDIMDIWSTLLDTSDTICNLHLLRTIP